MRPPVLLERPVRWFGVALVAFACGASDPSAPDGPALPALTVDERFGLEGCPPATENVTCQSQRAILGVSMGAAGAGQFGFSRPELFDVIGMLGVPLVDWVYMLRVLERSYMAGFCDRPSILENLDRVNDPDGPAFCGPVPGVVRLTRSSERWANTLIEPAQDYNHWYRWIDAGRGGTFARSTFRRSFQDIALAYGNPLAYHPESPYYAPGLPLDYRIWSDSEKCDAPLRIEGVRHDAYNPDGTHDVIAFCDTRSPGGDFAVDLPADVPIEFALAVDYNGNGVRDFAEPVLVMGHERYEDVGVGSDDAPYDWDTHPGGTKGNWRYDEGEPFFDDGLDGVPNTGDFGEGNGRFDVSPNVERILRSDPRTLMESLPRGQLDRISIYADAGIRDFLMSAAAMNWFWGALGLRTGNEARDYTTFERMGVGPDAFGFLDVDYAAETVGRHVYVRYGNPDAPDDLINEGDGHHLGTIPQVLTRLLVALAFTDSRFRERDRTLISDPGDLNALIETRTFYSPSLDEAREFGIVVPPGYDLPENRDRRYPVVYLLHGQGMDATQFLASALLFVGHMADAVDSDNRRRSQSDWGKFILVFPDSTCSKGACSTGNFNTNHAGFDGAGPAYADSMFELMVHVESTYRVARPRFFERP